MPISPFRALTLLSLLLLSRPVFSDAPDECHREPAGLRETEIVTIRATGDIVIGTDFPVSHYPPGFEARLENTLRTTLGQADVIFGNFEGALTTHNRSPKLGSGSPYVFAFRMPPHFASMLRRSGFGILNIANNHSYDFGEKGFNDTIAYLAQAGIETIGEQDKIVVMRVKGVRIAWVGFNYSIRHNDMHDFPRLERLVREAKGKADLVVVSIQAGAEGNEALRVVDREEIFLGERRGNTFAFAHRAVDVGADLVIGHGPHVLRGMECYKGKLIAYSLGNFVGYNALSIKRAAAISAAKDARDRRGARALPGLGPGGGYHASAGRAQTTGQAETREASAGDDRAVIATTLRAARPAMPGMERLVLLDPSHRPWPAGRASRPVATIFPSGYRVEPG